MQSLGCKSEMKLKFLAILKKNLIFFDYFISKQ